MTGIISAKTGFHLCSDFHLRGARCSGASRISALNGRTNMLVCRYPCIAELHSALQWLSRPLHVSALCQPFGMLRAGSEPTMSMAPSRDSTKAPNAPKRNAEKALPEAYPINNPSQGRVPSTTHHWDRHPTTKCEARRRSCCHLRGLCRSHRHFHRLRPVSHCACGADSRASLFSTWARIAVCGSTVFPFGAPWGGRQVNHQKGEWFAGWFHVWSRASGV